MTTSPLDYGWRWAVDSPCWLNPRRSVYFITRVVSGKREDLNDKRGRLRTWRTSEAAEKQVLKLKQLETKH